MTLKQQVIEYSYLFFPPHVHETIINNISSYKDDLSDLIKYNDFIYTILKEYIKNPELIQKIDLSVSKEQSQIDINSAFFGVIIGLTITLFLHMIINLITN
jgi:hypothetical protein